MITFDEAVPRIMAARRFSELTTDDSGRAKTYRKWVKVVHPDTVSAAQSATATQAFAKLSALYAEAGANRKQSASRPGNSRLHRGDIADFYEKDGDALLKVPRDPADNDLMRAEATALRTLRENGHPKFRAYAPRLLDTFTFEDRDRKRRTVNVLRRQHGMRPIQQIGSLADGIWIWRKLLVALGWAHRAGVIHGAVLEPHVLIHPEFRGLTLVDWCYSGDRPQAIVKAWKSAYPPEVLHDRTATPATDIYMANGLITRLLGDKMPAPLRRFAYRRTTDAWALLAQLDEI
ncbi:molecular chaperone DnaJ [Actinoplanes sp. NBC_00393]|uniref:molecular chaperone DnaJ n=1 Tax=Actinoplanes sp. NBC_00393 TaxID=2975953 RepID=UPI002E1AC904